MTEELKNRIENVKTAIGVCSINGDCRTCPYDGMHLRCFNHLMKESFEVIEALEGINRLKTEHPPISTMTKGVNKVRMHSSLCAALNALYERKNADYGDSFGKSFAEYGMTMACIRLEDKLNRIKSLSTKDAQVKDESITDTLMDLANYAIMTLIELSNTKARGAEAHGED